MSIPQNSDWNHFWQRAQSERFGQISWSKQRILQVLAPYAVANRKALDAGCGSGYFSAFFCDRGMSTVALDFSQSALDRTNKMTNGRAKTVQTDLMQGSLKDLLNEKFDLIFTDGLFEHFPSHDQNKILQNLCSVLSSDGVIVTFVPNRWSPWELIRPLYMPGIDEQPFILSQLKDLNRRNGLQILKSGGLNVLPFFCSPEILGPLVGMLLFTIAKNE